jgi:hypothetical protein
MLVVAVSDLTRRPGVHVYRVRHEAPDGTQGGVAVRPKDDPEVGALAAVLVDRPEEFALMTFWHFYNLPPHENYTLCP